MTPPSWLELLVRIIAGEPEEVPFTGILEVPAGDDPDWPTVVRVFKDRGRHRVESLEGTVLTIRNDEHTFVFRGEDDPSRDGHVDGAHVGDPQRYDNAGDGAHHPGVHGHDIGRREPGDWSGDDFTTPVGPARPVTYLGRAAWEVELAPPEHKPSALLITIDAVTGMTYEQRSVEFGLLSRWTEIQEVESHPEALFIWEGDAYWFGFRSGEMSDDDERDWERERTERSAALDLPPLDLAVRVELYPHETEEDGSFFASLDVNASGVLIRRPTSTDPWQHDIDYPHVERWSDDLWDWCVASDTSADHLAQIRRQLAEPRTDRR